MPKLFCKVHKEEVSLFKADFEKITDKENYVCMGCTSVIYTKDYPPGKVTLFTPIGTKGVGTALGDQILTKLVFDQYVKDNPNEQVTFLTPENDTLKWIEELKPDKIFISEFNSANKEEIEKLPGAIKYRMINEICNYARDGVYPENPFKSKYVFHKDFDYAVLHVRDINKIPDHIQTVNGPIDIKKNMPKDEAYKLALELGRDRTVVIVGNDKRGDTIQELGNVIDLRYRLTLSQIAGVLKNCKLFVGRDSGLVHLAAACGANIIAYNFSGQKWFPKTDSSKYKAFMKNIPFKEVLETIKNFPF